MESSDRLARRLATQERVWGLIQPELTAIMAAATAIEKKVGTGASDERELAIQLATTATLRSFCNIPCGVFGWAEFRQEEDTVYFYGCSYAHDLFLQSDRDMMLSFLMSKLISRIEVEQFELTELVQNKRNALGGQK